MPPPAASVRRSWDSDAGSIVLDRYRESLTVGVMVHVIVWLRLDASPRPCPYRKLTPDVLVMRSTKVWLRENRSGALNFARNWRVPVQRQMRASRIVVGYVRSQQVPKVPFAKHNDMVEHLSPDRANQPFSIGVLPWRSRCR